MPMILILPPVGEPVSLDEAKVFLRLDSNDEDALISALITAARTHVEAVTGRALMTQGWRLTLDAWPRRRVVRIARLPVQAIDAVCVRDSEGVASPIDVSQYSLDAACRPARLVIGDAAPAPGQSVAGIEIDFTAGYGDAGDVPKPLVLAVERLVAHWYENRGAVPPDGGGDTPGCVAALLAPYRLISLGVRT